MTLKLDPAVANAVSKSLDDTGNAVTVAEVEEPSGFDWSNEAVENAISIINQSMAQLGKRTRGMAATIAVDVREFQAYDNAQAKKFQSTSTKPR